jgi:transposase
MSQRRNFGAAFKSKVAVAAIQGDKTLNEIASQYEVHPNQISQWKKQAIERLPGTGPNGMIPGILSSVRNPNTVHPISPIPG